MRERAEAVPRAKLKIFFGYAPGIGKTYTMLESARALSSEGVDVLVGAVETHRRYDTAALLLGLDIQQRRRVVYRGAELAEFDVEAALARRPRVLLLDELAHVNAPGGRHSRRWQDVLDLLDAGIDVHTTLNVQEVESLNDVVATRSSTEPTRSSWSTFRRTSSCNGSPRARSTCRRRQCAPRSSCTRAATCWHCASWRCAARPSGSRST
jgi:K+-sensing histidine kinase KdpD